MCTVQRASMYHISQFVCMYYGLDVCMHDGRVYEWVCMTCERAPSGHVWLSSCVFVTILLYIYAFIYVIMMFISL